MKRSFIREILEHTTDKSISFAGGLPDGSLFPNQELKKSASSVLENPNILQYSTSAGYEPLKKKIATLYKNEGFPTTSDEILITSGSQQALDIIARYHHDKSITIEAPSYLGAMNIFSLNKLIQESITLKNSGIDIKKFKTSFKNTRLTYMIPDFQNPSGYTYSSKKREEIAKIVKEYDGVLIEDSPYSKLYFEKAYKSISSLIPSCSYHLGSFSKTLAPSLRIGWIRADKKLLNPLISYKETMDLHTNGLAQHILNDYLEDESRYEKHLESLRKSYHIKMQFFTKTLDKLLPQFIYKKPKGGMFIYGKFSDIDTSVLVKKCLEQNVAFVPGVEFYTHNKIKNEIRFNFTNTSEKEMTLGLEIIKKVYADSI